MFYPLKRARPANNLNQKTSKKYIDRQELGIAGTRD